MTYADLIRQSLLELTIIDPIDPTPPEMQALGLERLNLLYDQWNAPQINVYSVDFLTFTTTAGLSPHTIGVTANTPTWVVTGNRPVAILGANQQLGSGTGLVNIGPLVLRDRAWWLANAVPNIQTGVPTDLYYEPAWPNGKVYLWPVPNAAYVVQLEMRIVLLEVAEADITNDFSQPPGYRRALMLTLAEDLCGPLSVAMPPLLERKASAARTMVFANNNPPIRICTRQAGMPGGPNGGGFNYLTGQGGGR